MESSESTDENASGTVREFIWLQAQFTWDKASQRLRRFAVEDTKTTWFVLMFTVLLFSGILMQSLSAVNPLRLIEMSTLLIISFLFVILGHSLSNVWTKVVVCKLTLSFSAIFLSFILCLHAFFGIFDNASLITQSFCFLTVATMSLLGGILSSGMQDSTWLASALFMRHINSKFQFKGISYLVWDSEGEVKLISANSVRVRWDSKSQQVVCYVGKKQYPLIFCAPVLTSGHQIKSAYSEILKMFDNLNSSWKNLLIPYSKALEYAEIRTSWLILFTISVHRDPYSLTSEQSKISVGTQSIAIGGKSRSISWNHPRLDWSSSLNTIFKRTESDSVINAALCYSLSEHTIHPLERSLEQGYSNDSDLITLVGLQRSYLSLVTVLFGNLSKRGSVVSELARRTLRGFSQWYPKLQRDPTFLICLQTVIANASNEKISFSSCNFWSDKFSQVADNPTSLYLTMRDKLSNLSNEDGLPFEQNAMIQQLISQTTRDIIGANKKPPINKQAESLAKDALVDGFQLEIGHKAQVVLCTVKLIFMYEFLLGGESQ
jgi:hypothetical protein